jgi:hypothetical protein
MLGCTYLLNICLTISNPITLLYEYQCKMKLSLTHTNYLVGHLLTLHVCIHQYNQGERTPFIVVNITLTVTLDQFVSAYIVPCFIKYFTCLNNCEHLAATRRQVFYRVAQQCFLGFNYACERGLDKQLLISRCAEAAGLHSNYV